MYIANLFLSFNGRIGRLQFWLGIIAVIVVEVAIEALLGLPISGDAIDRRSRILGFIIGVIALYPTMAVSVKRLRDRRESVSYIWLLVAAFAVALLGDLFGFFNDAVQPTLVTWIAAAFAAIVTLGFLIDLGFRRGRQ